MSPLTIAYVRVVVKIMAQKSHLLVFFINIYIYIYIYIYAHTYTQTRSHYVEAGKVNKK